MITDDAFVERVLERCLIRVKVLIQYASMVMHGVQC